MTWGRIWYAPCLTPGLTRLRIEYTCVSLGLMFLKQSVCGSAAEDNNSTKEVTEMSFFPERVGYLCNVFRLLFVQFPRRGCFLSMFSVRHEDVFIETSYRSQASSSPVWDMELNNIPKTQYANWDKLCLDPIQAEFYCSSKHQRDRRSLQPGLSLRKHILCLPSVQGKRQIKVCVHLCVLLCVYLSHGTKYSTRWIANPPGPFCLRPNNMMSREKPQVQATKNILHPADEPQASFQWSCSPLERETWMESMLPAQLGTHPDMPRGLTFKATKRQELLQQLSQKWFHTQWSKLNNCQSWSRCAQASLPQVEARNWINECIHLSEKKWIHVNEMVNGWIYIGLFYLSRTKCFTKFLIHPRAHTHTGLLIWSK